MGKMQMARKTTLTTSNVYPLFIPEDELAVAILGAARAHEWNRILGALEQDYKTPFPSVNKRMGGVFWPHVIEYFSNVLSSDKANEAMMERFRNDPRRPIR
jgi:hypothetical protein